MDHNIGTASNTGQCLSRISICRQLVASCRVVAVALCVLDDWRVAVEAELVGSVARLHEAVAQLKKVYAV